jgi:hypothetical protein
MQSAGHYLSRRSKTTFVACLSTLHIQNLIHRQQPAKPDKNPIVSSERQKTVVVTGAFERRQLIAALFSASVTASL